MKLRLSLKLLLVIALVLTNFLSFEIRASSMVILEETFEVEEDMGLFSQTSVSINFNWRWLENDFDGRFVEMNGFGADGVSDDWLIFSEPLDLTKFANPVLTFNYIPHFGGPNIEVKVSSDYETNIQTNPADMAWEVLSFFTEGENDPEGGSWSPQFSNEIDLTPYKDTSFYVGLHYVSEGAESGQGVVWRVDNFRIVNADPAPILLNTPFEEAIEPWVVMNLGGGEEWENAFFDDRDGVFGDGSFANDGSDDWLISPPVAVTEGEVLLANLDYYTDFSGPTIQMLVSSDYDPNVHTNPVDATRSEVYVPFETVDTITWVTLPSISLNGYFGEKLSIAFRYQVEAGNPVVARVQGLANVCLFKGIEAPAPSASVAVSTTQPTTGEAIYFLAQASGGRVPYTFAWDFGDGNDSDLVRPSHTYVNSGTYSVELVVTDADGLMASAQQVVTITIKTDDTYVRVVMPKS